MTKGRLKQNSIKGMMIFSMFTILSIKSCAVNAQSSRQMLDDSIYKKVRAWEDSVRRINSRKNPIYLGGELALAFPQHILKSTVDVLDGLRVNYIGTKLGGVVGNAVGKLKANAGLYYSEPSVPYTFEMLQGGVSANVYLLRIKKVKYHTFEPYATIGVVRQQTKYYGNYLNSPDNSSTTSANTNNSISDPALLGKIGSTQMRAGAGVEYQFESCNNLFIHFFAEVGYGVLLSSNTSNKSLAGTKSITASTISLGINFGIIK